jgi:hypothetical protein
VLVADSNTHVTVRLEYEKRELLRDIHFLNGGETALLEVLRCQHEKMRSVNANSQWVEPQLPSWSDSIESAMVAMRAASATRHAQGQGNSPPFCNFITDRDGTTNNYCDRYSSSVQSAYNAVWVSEFAQRCVENTILITAAPLGGRPNSQGLLELCTMPNGFVTYAGSKGREYYDNTKNAIVEVEPTPLATAKLLDTLHGRLATLCMQPCNSKFLGIGSGLQYKCGELTMSHNDPARSVSPSESSRFKHEVQHLIHEFDPEGHVLNVHDTGTDIDVCLRAATASPLFTKSNGMIGLDQRLRLGVADGPNLICGDTPSDLPMVKAALHLMGQDASSLAVLFVISPEQYRTTPALASEIRTLCAESGAHCAFVPSPDILVAALAQFTKEVTRGVTIASLVGPSVPAQECITVASTL